MTTRTASDTIKCFDDCLQSGCPGHEVSISVQTTSDWFTYTKDGQFVFGMDTDEVKNLIKMIQELNYL